MRILFCKVSWMKYYQGAGPDDTPVNGGSYVNTSGYGHEELNFLPVKIEHLEHDNGELEVGEYHFGFVHTMRTNKVTPNQLRIENINGCSSMKKEAAVDNVLVVWFATSDLNETYVVGWYRNASVFRQYQSYILNFEDGTSEERIYNVVAKTEDCTLLPHNQRRSFTKWRVPSKKYTRSFGYGQSMLWYASEENESVQKFLTNLIENMNEYDKK